MCILEHATQLSGAAMILCQRWNIVAKRIFSSRSHKTGLTKVSSKHLARLSCLPNEILAAAEK